MTIQSYQPRRFFRLAMTVCAVACLAVCGVALRPAPVEAGSLVIPAWAFARGNVEIHADPEKYADAGPVVVGGAEDPWGWSVEYEIDVPVEADYKIQICFASAESRTVEVLFDGGMIGRSCTNVTFPPASAKQPTEPTFNSSGANWETVHRFGVHPISVKATKGKHKLTITRKGPMPHLVALRMDTAEEFPAGWKPPEYKVADIDSVPEEFRAALAKTAQLPSPVDFSAGQPVAASMTIPSWTFDRGNAKVYAGPDKFADGHPLIGGSAQAEETAVEYDIDFPVDADYTLQFHYASDKARPVDVWLDGKYVGSGCNGVTVDSRPTEYPVTFSRGARVLKWQGLFDHAKGTLVSLPITKGKHTLKIGRRGTLPSIGNLRLDSTTAFPEGWQQPERTVDMTRVEPRLRSVFLPPNAVNTAALREAIEDTIATLGPQYPDGQQYLKQLSDLEAKQTAAEDKQKIEDELAALRSRALLTHPALKFDKLLFLQRPSGGYGSTYADQDAGGSSGNLCVLSPVSPDGQVTPLVPELEGGLFDRFDLSFDGKRVVFGHKKQGGSFRIYEVDIDPEAGKMIPGSLRQLTSAADNEAEIIKCNDVSGRCRSGGFDDMDPCYLPDRRIIFVSTRSMRKAFCGSGGSTTLYIIDADGKNMRCLSAGPINELSPTVTNDGRVMYTRWEYVDKGLGNGESLWVIRPDGSGSDHVYKNNTVWPAGMSSARSIPGSQKIVTIGGGHHLTAVGTVVLVDARRSRRTTEAMTCITPETGYPNSMGPPKTKYGIYMDPYPFSEKFFLVSHKLTHKGHGGRYGIYALDAWGNRTPLYQDPNIDCFEPMPLRPRRKPTSIVPIAETNSPLQPLAGPVGTPTIKPPATLLIQDIYRGMTGIERGRVKYVRVMGALEWPWNREGVRLVGPDVHRKKVYGVVKVHEDGSVYFKVPADENLFFQALDENYMSLQHMATFVNLMPGEQRACIGCHERRRDAPAMVSARPMALENPPQTMVPQPGDTGPRMVHYAADVQSTFDKKCVGCHNEENPKGNLDLTGVPTTYNRSYDTLRRGYLINYRRACSYGAGHFRAVPPLSHGAHLSKLVDRIKRDPCKADITREEFIKIVTWIDANVPYYGTYDGEMNPGDKDHPNFRQLPLVSK